MSDDKKDEKKVYKMIDMSIRDGKFHLSVDPNKDGEPVLVLALDLAEIPDEIISVFMSKKN